MYRTLNVYFYTLWLISSVLKKLCYAGCMLLMIMRFCLSNSNKKSDYNGNHSLEIWPIIIWTVNDYCIMTTSKTTSLILTRFLWFFSWILVVYFGSSYFQVFLSQMLLLLTIAKQDKIFATIVIVFFYIFFFLSSYLISQL